MSGQSKCWSPPLGLVIQPDSLLVPGRTGYVAENGNFPGARIVFEDGRFSCRFTFAGRPSGGARCALGDLDQVSVTRWDLSSLTESELDSLQVAIDAQRQAGVGRRCPATRADRLALGVER